MKATFIQLPSLEGEPRYCRAERIAAVEAIPPNPQDNRFGGAPMLRIVWTMGGCEDFPFASPEDVAAEVNDLILRLNS